MLAHASTPSGMMSMITRLWIREKEENLLRHHAMSIGGEKFVQFLYPKYLRNGELCTDTIIIYIPRDS